MINRKSLLNFFKNDGAKSLFASLISIFIGIAAGCVIIMIVASADDKISLKSGIEAVKLILFGTFSKGRDASGNLVFSLGSSNIGDLLFRATPVIMTGLSVAFAFKTGLFNIGTSGQFLTGTAATLLVALSLPELLPAFLRWLLAFLSGMAAGALWGIIPGLLKARFKINEVLSCIMTNWIAANLVTWIFENSHLRNGAQSGKIGYIMPTSAKGISTAKLGLDMLFPDSQVNAGILLAILFAVIIYIFLFKTTPGFENRICGSNTHAAEYAGINGKRKIVLTMAFAGALAGGGAALYWLSGNTEFFWSTYQSLPQEGFNGIPVALLASSNPLGVIFTGCFLSSLGVAGQQLKDLTSYNEYITDIIIALIVYLSAFSFVIGQLIYVKKKRESEGEK
ncbi:MAG: ABC transporter permease [Clostridia bacterium]|nr:ABC transporter permease [Clostridia bacterium]